MSISTLLAVCSMFGLQHGSKPSTVDGLHKQQTEVLRDLAETLPLNLVVDLTEVNHNLPRLTLGSDEHRLLLLAAHIRKSIARTPNAILIAGHQQAVLSSARNQSTDLIEVIGSLSAEELKLASKGQLRFSSLSVSQRNAVLRSCAVTPELTEGIIARLEALRLTIRPSVSLQFLNPRTGKVSETVLPAGIASQDFLSRAAEPASKKPKPARDGAGPTINFKSGELMLLPELLDRAGSHFGASYRLDVRLRHVRLFVSGEYNKEEFDQVLRRITEVPPVTATPDIKVVERQRIDSLATGVLREAFEGLGLGSDFLPEELIKRPSFRAADIRLLNEVIFEILKRSQVPDDAQVRVGPVIELFIDGGTQEARVGLVLWRY